MSKQTEKRRQEIRDRFKQTGSISATSKELHVSREGAKKFGEG